MASRDSWAVAKVSLPPHWRDVREWSMEKRQSYTVRHVRFPAVLELIVFRRVNIMLNTYTVYINVCSDMGHEWFLGLVVISTVF